MKNHDFVAVRVCDFDFFEVTGWGLVVGFSDVLVRS